MNSKLAYVAIIVGLIAIPLSIFTLNPVITETSEEVVRDYLPIAPSVRSDASMAYYYYYSQDWDVCIIDGQEIRNVRFSWSDLGQTMIIDGEEIYRQFDITECRRVIPEIREGR